MGICVGGWIYYHVRWPGAEINKREGCRQTLGRMRVPCLTGGCAMYSYVHLRRREMMILYVNNVSESLS